MFSKIFRLPAFGGTRFVICLITGLALLPASANAGGGPDVRRLSDMGVNGDPMVDARRSAVAVSLSSRHYLTVWEGNEVDSMPANGEYEIYGQLLDRDGEEIGVNDFRISFQGGDGSSSDNDTPAVAWNSNANEFLVVWVGNTEQVPQVGLFQIWGQRINAASGALVGGNFRISNVGFSNFAFDPAVEYNASDDQYLVVWESVIEESPPNEFEIYGVRVSGGGAVLGPDVRLTHHATDGDRDFDAENPRLAWNSVNGEYLVVFEGTQSLEIGELQEVEAFGQRVSAAGTAIGSTFRISAMGVEGDATYKALDPDVAFHRGRSEYLVVWSSADDRGTLHILELEIWGQRLNAAGVEIGEDDFRISFQGDDGDAFKDTEVPAVAWNAFDGSYLVAWEAPTVEGIEEYEIFAQALNAIGGLDGPALRLSFMGPAEDLNYAGLRPAVAANGALGDFLVAWEGDDDTLPLVDGELEIFGRNVGEQVTLIFADGFESGNTSAWSSTSP